MLVRLVLTLGISFRVLVAAPGKTNIIINLYISLLFLNPGPFPLYYIRYALLYSKVCSYCMGRQYQYVPHCTVNTISHRSIQCIICTVRIYEYKNLPYAQFGLCVCNSHSHTQTDTAKKAPTNINSKRNLAVEVVVHISRKYKIRINKSSNKRVKKRAYEHECFA